MHYPTQSVLLLSIAVRQSNAMVVPAEDSAVEDTTGQQYPLGCVLQRYFRRCRAAYKLPLRTVRAVVCEEEDRVPLRVSGQEIADRVRVWELADSEAL